MKMENEGENILGEERRYSIELKLSVKVTHSDVGRGYRHLQRDLLGVSSPASTPNS